MMTVPVVTPSGSYVSDGSLTARAIPFPFLAAADIVVTVDTVARVLNTHYQISGAYPAATLVPLAGFANNGQTVRYRRQTPARQDYEVSGNSINARALETALDRETMVLQEVAADVESAFADIDAIAAPIAAAAAAAVAVDIQAIVDAMTLNGVYASLSGALAGGTTGQFVAVALTDFYAIDTYAKIDSSSLLLAPGFQRPSGVGVAAATRIAAQNVIIGGFPVAPLFTAWGIDGYFTDGRMVPARGTSPSRNMIQKPDFSQQVNNGAVITAGLPDPWGGNTAYRVQLPGSTSYVVLFQFSAAISPTEAGDYRIGFMAKSNTGAGNQNFTLHKDLAAPLVTVAVTEAAWVSGELQLPGMTNTDYVTIYNPTGTTPLDLIITPLALSESAVKLPAQPIPATGGIVNNRLSRVGALTIDNKGNIVGPFKGRINFTDNGLAHRTFPAMSMWVMLKKTASSGAFNFNAPIWARTSGQPDLVLGTEADLFSIKGPGLTSFAPDPSWNAYGDGHLMLCIRFDATRTVASLGSIELATGTGTGGTAFEIPWAWFMGGYSDGVPFPGLVHSYGVFDSFIEDADWATIVRGVNQIARADGNALGAENILFSAGDSITNGAGATGLNGFMQQIATNLGLKRFSEAVSGTAFVDQIADPRSANFIRKITQCIADGKNAIVHELIGTNSPQPVQSDFQTRINLWRGLGAKVIVSTIPDRTARPAGVTAAYNSMIRSLSCDGIADYAADGRLGAAGAAANMTYFNGDGIHPNDAGHAIMQAIGQPIIAALRR